MRKQCFAERYYADHFSHLQKRYDRALENHRIDKLLVYSGAVKTRFQDDLPYPFFPAAQFKAIVPLINAPESWVIWQAGNKPILLLYQPEDYWHVVPQLLESYWTPYFTIVSIVEKEQASEFFGDTQHSAFLGEPNRHIKEWIAGQYNPEPLIAELNWHRSYKTLYEQACIREANKTSSKGHIAARQAFYHRASELDIALAFQQACQQSEEMLAYPSIVAVNQHAAILHYWGRDSSVPGRTHSLLIDAAASCYGYAADITRTYSFYHGLFADLITALDRVQRELVSKHQVGVRYFDLNVLALHKIPVILEDAGVLKMSATTAVECGVAGHFLPHPLGHFLGLQVHDVGANQRDASGALIDIDPNYPRFRMLRTIEPNQVVTVEPGIYFIEPLLKQLQQGKHRNAIDWALVAQLRSCGGIRIEDNVLITEDGPQNLTRIAM